MKSARGGRERKTHVSLVESLDSSDDAVRKRDRNKGEERQYLDGDDLGEFLRDGLVDEAWGREEVRERAQSAWRFRERRC